MHTSILESQSTGQQTFHFGHLSLVLVVAVTLGLITLMKNPSLLFFKQKSPAAQSVNVPRYYAYVPPPEDTAPLVAGASTNNGGPSIINEDGTISPVINLGEVLGVSTEDFDSNLDAINVNTVPDSEETIRQYWNDVDGIESNYLNSLELETALTSNNPLQLNEQSEKIKLIVSKLQKLSVPVSLSALHKNKILQYNAAITILQNYKQVDQNPEVVSQALGIFLQAQQEMENFSSLRPSLSAQ